MHFPIIMHTKPQTYFAIRGQLWKSDRATKIVVTSLFNDGFEKRKTPIEAVYALFWDIIFFVSYQFIYVPEKIPEVRARSFWLTLY